ncbi:Molybdenum cofactor guanylyltransferase [Actinomyces israelii]|nr:Molybdenum cofactor guanylyltransferase [Actinomyces israelii]
MIDGAGGPDADGLAGTSLPGGEGVDVVVLAGGTGRRLGGASKPDVVARGARLLDHVLAGLKELSGRAGPAGPPAGGGPGAGRVVVVAPGGVALPAGVLRALEDPPLGGPVAGIAAGLARLAQDPGPAALTAVVTCDAPESWRALPALVAAASRGADGACALEGDHVQYLLGVYRTAALTRCAAPGGVALRDVSVRRALGGLAVVRVDLGDLRAAARDLDTWEDVRAWDRG